MDNGIEYEDLKNFELPAMLTNLNNDFKIFYDKNNQDVYIVLLHLGVEYLDEIIKTENVIYGMTTFSDGLEEDSFYLKITLNNTEKGYFKRAKKVHITDINNFIKSERIKSINFKGDGENNNFAFDINFEMKNEFLSNEKK
jgi:hypothetical protein